MVLSSAGPDAVGAWFERPELAVRYVRGCRAAHPLSDPDGLVEAMQRRANAFTWTEALSARADAWVASQMAGWAEEAGKGLEGLARDDVGRLLNARFGLSWGLARVLTVRERVLLEGDNTFLDDLDAALGPSSEPMVWLRAAFGLAASGPSLPEQVRAGLRLYLWLASCVAPLAPPAQREVIAHTAAAIEEVLGRTP